MILRNELGIRNLFVATETPRDPRLEMRVFRESFGQSVRERLCNDGAVIVVRRFEFFSNFVRAVNRDGKAAQIIGRIRSDIISEAMVELSRRFLHLLPQKIKS